jgi:8-oxo-dGTP diphosphatase
MALPDPAEHSLVGYNPDDYPRVAVTVDIVVFTIVDNDLRVLLIQRGEPPFLGRWAFPGGFVKPDENLDHAAVRELAEETLINQEVGLLEQLGSYGSPERDPRMRVVTVAYWAIVPDLPSPTGGSDAMHAELVSVSEVESGRLRLAFDHELIFADALETARSSIEDRTIAPLFCPPDFKVSQLRNVYNSVWATELDAGNFQRKVTSADGFLSRLESPPVRSGDKGGRPASLWKAGPAKKLNPPITRPSKTQ